MQLLSSFSRAWTHVQYRAQSLLPCPFYHKSQSSEASNHKSTDEATIISLFADSASPSSSSTCNHVLLLPLFYLMWDADRLGKALTRGTACQQTARPTSSKNKKAPPPSARQNHLLFTNLDTIIFQINIIEICIDSTQEQNQVVRLRSSTMCRQI